MYPQNQQPGTVGKVIIKEAPASQAQLAAMAQMQEQMRQMQAQLEAQRQPKVKVYSFGQVQILLCCESINHVLEEFDLCTQKRQRLNMARDYLLALSDLDEFITQPAGTQEHAHEGGEGEGEGVPLEETLFDEDNQPVTAPKAVAQAGAEQYQGKVDKTVEEEIERINKKMAELKKNEAIESEKPKKGFDKIKAFLSKKNPPASGEAKKPDYSDVPEGVG